MLLAQGPHGQDGNNQQGHGHMPPGQAKKYDHNDRDDRGLPPGQAKKYERFDRDDRGLPPGQAKKYFRDSDRDRFYAQYRRDADNWRGRMRPVFVPGQYVGRQYVVRPVPRSIWVTAVAPPPPGYQYGYYGGYVVAYDPTTRMIADVLDLLNTTTAR